jgi:hypothetical protein
MSFRSKLDAVMAEIGYKTAIDGKTDLEIIQLIEQEIISLEEINQDEPYELVKYDLKDIFYQKQWINIDMLISDEQLEKLYYLLCDYKRVN